MKDRGGDEWGTRAKLPPVPRLRRDRPRDQSTKRDSREAPIFEFQTPRRKFVEISHRSRYWKGRPRNYRGLN